MVKKYMRRLRLASRVMRGKASVITVSAVKTSADGTVTNYGVIATGPLDMHADVRKAVGKNAVIGMTATADREAGSP